MLRNSLVVGAAAYWSLLPQVNALTSTSTFMQETNVYSEPIIKATAVDLEVHTTVTDIPVYTSQAPFSDYHTIPYPSVKPNETFPACKKIQYNFAKGAGSNATRANAVKEAYRYAWDAYKQYAFGYDELLPLSATGTNDWYGWGVTIVDGIDTAIVMNLTDIVAEQLAFIEKIDFTTTEYGPVEIFDTNIRYVGGLLSSYDLLKSGLFYNDYPQSQIDALLSQAVSLADKIAYGFNTPTGIQSVDVNFTSNEPVQAIFQASNGDTYNATNTASIGTFILEWARLSDLTGNETYRQLTERAESYLVNPSPEPVYPGLDGTQFDVDTGKMLTFDGGWHSSVDSFLEYTIKTWYYQETPQTIEYKNFWEQAVASTIEHLSLAPYDHPDLYFLSSLDNNGSLTWTQDDFACFAGGNFFLGGAALGQSQFIELGIRSTDSCHQTYNQTITGLGPIAWGWFNSTNGAQTEQINNDAAAHKSNDKFGFYIENGNDNWEFRPEEIESIFYGHRITGDPRWAEYNWEIFQAIQNTAKNNIAYATVEEVNTPFGGFMGDNLDSFFFAEVLKYLYLSFTDPDVVNLNQWVFNTECHPFLVQCGDLGGIDDGTSPPYTNGTGTVPPNPTPGTSSTPTTSTGPTTSSQTTTSSGVTTTSTTTGTPTTSQPGGGWPWGWGSSWSTSWSPPTNTWGW